LKKPIEGHFARLFLSIYHANNSTFSLGRENIPIPPGIKDKVIELLKHKMDAGVYEHCQSAYRSKWFCVLKKSGKLRLVHDLQALNAVSIRDAGGPPILDDFVEPFAGRQCYTVFDLFWGF